MYAIVDGSDGMYIIPGKWITLDEGDEIVEIVYPRRNGSKDPLKAVKKQKDPQDNWEKNEVTVLKKGIESFEAAIKSMHTRQNYSNTESEMETFNNKKLSRELRKKKIDDEYNLNGMLSRPAKKLKLDIINAKKGTTESNVFKKALEIPEISQATSIIPHSSSTSSSFAHYLNDSVQDFVPQVHLMSQKSESCTQVNRKEFDALRNDVKQCLANSELLIEMISGLNDNFKKITDERNEPEYLPENLNISPINAESELKEMEDKLQLYIKAPNVDKEFKNIRKLMVKHYGSVLRSTKHGADPKIGLIDGLLSLYISEDLISKVGWTLVEGTTIAMKDYSGHMHL
ncbi:hypothetical protein ACKWTF_016550 [Chironomus riparius]